MLYVRDFRFPETNVSVGGKLDEREEYASFLLLLLFRSRARSEVPAVWGEHHRPDCVGVALEGLADLVPRHRIPQSLIRVKTHPLLEGESRQVSQRRCIDRGENSLSVGRKVIGQAA